MVLTRDFKATAKGTRRARSRFHQGHARRSRDDLPQQHPRATYFILRDHF